MEITDTTTGGVSRLTITPLTNNVTLKNPPVSPDTANAMEVQFNPETMSLSKSNYCFHLIITIHHSSFKFKILKAISVMSSFCFVRLR